MAMRRPGTYVPLSAHYADDEKIMEAGEDAELLYLRMLAYAARTPLTEGWISDRVLRSRLGILPRESGNGAGTVPGTDAGSRAERLRDSRLIEREGDGWRIISWLRWNRSAEEMGREQARDRSRKTSGNNGTDTGNGAGSRAGSGAGLPHPIPTADTDTDTEEAPRAGARTRVSRFEEFWKLYPRKTSKGHAEKAWAKAVKDTDPQAILDALTAQRPALARAEAQFIAHPATWLNGRRWEDEPPRAAGQTGATDTQGVFAGIPRPNELHFHDEDDT